MTLKQILDSRPELHRGNGNDRGTDKNTYHSYIDSFYDKEFARYQDEEINFLEIGIDLGGSAVLWSSFFKKANIYAIDPRNAILKEDVMQNVNYIFKDAYDLNLIKTLPDFDIVIDDGPHTLESQISCIQNYLKKIKNGGILIIEDIQNIDHFDRLKEFVPNQLKDNIECIDLRNVKNRYDDLMFVVRK
jgi:hypothetical protein